VLDEADITVHLDQELGRGSYGVVYKAEYHGQPCVLKVCTCLLFPLSFDKLHKSTGCVSLSMR
jgi:hypothetical protein